MTETTVVAIAIAAIASIAPTIASLAAFRQGQANGVKTDALTVKAEEIHMLTNSNLSAVKADLLLANKRIEALETLLVQLTHRTHEGEAP